MKRNYLKIIVSSLLISVIGVFGVDYFFHLFFSNPMETLSYFLAKMTLYFVFSIAFLFFFNLKKQQFLKVFIAGIVVSLIWGTYYNILPAIFDYYPFGIPLNGLTFLGMGLIGTGIAFGAVHTLAFVIGYYLPKFMLNLFNK